MSAPPAPPEKEPLLIQNRFLRGPDSEQKTRAANQAMQDHEAILVESSPEKQTSEMFASPSSKNAEGVKPLAKIFG